jgi:hypothetical protein
MGVFVGLNVNTYMFVNSLRVNLNPSLSAIKV